MTVKELRDYLENYRDDEEISFMIGNISKRIAHKVERYGLIRKDDDIISPVIYLEVMEGRSFDELEEYDE